MNKIRRHYKKSVFLGGSSRIFKIESEASRDIDSILGIKMILLLPKNEDSYIFSFKSITCAIEIFFSFFY